MTTDTIEVRGPDGQWRDLLTGRPARDPVLRPSPVVYRPQYFHRGGRMDDMVDAAIYAHTPPCNR